MKNALLMIFSISIIFFVNCDDGQDGKFKSTKVSLFVVNKSKLESKLELYQKNNQLYKLLNLDTTNQQIFIESGYIEIDGETYKLTSGIIDSAVIIFKDQKKLIFTYLRNVQGYNDTINNPLNKYNYTVSFGPNRAEDYLFTITENDYKRAK